MAKPNNDDFLGKPAAFNKVGGRNAQVTEPVEIVHTPGPRISAKAVVISLALIVLAAFLVFLGEGGLGGITHRPGVHKGVTPAQSMPEQPKNF